MRDYGHDKKYNYDISNTTNMIYISLPYATFILIDDINGKIIEAAPIARWTVGKDTADVIRYFKNKKAIIEYIDE